MAYKNESGGGYKGMTPKCIGEQGGGTKTQSSGGSGGGGGYKGLTPKGIGEQGGGTKKGA